MEAQVSKVHDYLNYRSSRPDITNKLVGTFPKNTDVRVITELCKIFLVTTTGIEFSIRKTYYAAANWITVSDQKYDAGGSDSSAMHTRSEG